MPEITGRLRTPRLAAAPASPARGEMYYDTTDNKLLWWNGTAWIEGGGSEFYEQPTDPGAVDEGAIWVETDVDIVYGPMWIKLTQAQYDALSPPDPNTLYMIVG